MDSSNAFAPVAASDFVRLAPPTTASRHQSWSTLGPLHPTTHSSHKTREARQRDAHVTALQQVTVTVTVTPLHSSHLLQQQVQLQRVSCCKHVTTHVQHVTHVQLQGVTCCNTSATTDTCCNTKCNQGP